MLGRRRPRLLLLTAPLAIAVACAVHAAPRSAQRPSPTPPLLATPYKPSDIYAVGEKVGWTVSLPAGVTPPAGRIPYTIKKDNMVPIGSGELDLSSGKGTIETTVGEPAMVYVQLAMPDGRPFALGAAVAPRDLKPVVPKPKDFDAFWKGKIAELEAIPANPVLTPGDSYKPDVEYATIRMDHVNGTHVYGQIARPKRPGKYPAIAMFQWASPPYPLQKPWVVEPASKGFIVLDIEPHDVLPTEAPAYYQALPDSIKHYDRIGRDDRDKSYFVEMYLRDYRAVDYLSKLPDWDGKTLIVMGTSMGGQQSLAVAGLHPRITHLMVEVPSGCDLNAGLHGRQQGYPGFTEDGPKAVETARYVDAINFAPRIRATSLVGMGFVDTVAPPAGSWTAFNLIRGPKEVAPMTQAPHNNLATREQQMPYNSRADAWLDSLAKTGRVEPRRDVGKP